MYRFFADEQQLKNEFVNITGDDYNHIRNVLRMKTGEEVLLSDGHDREYSGRIESYDDSARSVQIKITDVFGKSRELPAKITLFQGYPKGDKMEQIIQKAVELGAYEIVPVIMNRCVARPDNKKAERKVERFNSIALSAAKQSKRGIIPKVTEVMSFEQALLYAKNLDYVIIPYECASGMEHSKSVMKEAARHSTIGVFIGPEGGFDGKEAASVIEMGGHDISLGHRILRTETAGMTVLSILMYMLEE